MPEEGLNKWYRAANGTPVPTYGTRSLNVKVKNGSTFGVNFVVMDVHRPLLSVHQVVQAGGEVHFTPSGSWIKKGETVINIESKGNIFTIPFQLLPPHEQQCFHMRHLTET